MCGVVAILDRRGVPDRAPLFAALQALAPRGPDGTAAWAGGPVLLGHTRLAMVGKSATQPVFNEDASVVAVVNGEIYGDAALREGLEARGHRLRGDSDSDLVVHLYEEEGDAFLSRLNGEFAILLWDVRRQRLLAARDPSGVRPLLWAERGGALVFASTFAALFAAGVQPTWDLDAVAQAFTFQYLLPGQSLFAGVHALPPGTLLLADTAGQHQHRWTLPVAKEPSETDLLQSLSAAVVDRLRGDAPIGCLLSGGLDSAAVAALARPHVSRLRAFTIAFDDTPAWNEREAARLTADALDLDHTVLSFDQDQLLDALPAAIAAGGALVINQHASARWLLAREVRAGGVRGLLSGEGADELFFGYAHLRADLEGAASALPDPARLTPSAMGIHLPWGRPPDLSSIRSALGFLPTFIVAKAALGERAAAILTPELRRRRSVGPLAAALLLTPSSGPAPRPPALAPVAAHSRLRQAAHLWTELCLSGYILPTLSDAQDLAHGVEGRVPFLDRRVVAIANSLPDSAKIHDGIEKYVLREALRGRLPEGVRLRPKQPFMAPPLRIDRRVRELLNDLPLPPFLDRSSLLAFATDAASLEGDARTAADPVLMLALSALVLQQVYAP